MRYKNITDIVIANIYSWDYPEFVDAYVSHAVWEDTGIELTEEELQDIFTDEVTHELLMDWIC